MDHALIECHSVETFVRPQVERLVLLVADGDERNQVIEVLLLRVRTRRGAEPFVIADAGDVRAGQFGHEDAAAADTGPKVQHTGLGR